MANRRASYPFLPFSHHFHHRPIVVTNLRASLTEAACRYFRFSLFISKAAQVVNRLSGITKRRILPIFIPLQYIDPQVYIRISDCIREDG